MPQETLESAEVLQVIDFQEPQLQVTLDAMEAAQYDDLPFGLVRMDADGTVNAYNREECLLSGLSADKVIGKNFFHQVAPCTNNFMVAQRFMDETDMDVTIDYVFTLKMRPTKVFLRMIKKPDAPHLYLLVAKRS